MKKFLISVLLVTLIFSVHISIVPSIMAEACTISYNWSKISNYGETEWVLYCGEQKVYGWHYINGAWYYLYPSNGYMAHDTFIDGYYVNGDGAWTNDIPYEIQRIKSVIPNSKWIDTFGNNSGTITIRKNQNLKSLYKNGWDIPDINGSLVIFEEGGEHFVASDGTVFKTAHQAYDKIYQYDNYGNVIKEYPYIESKN